MIINIRKSKRNGFKSFAHESFEKNLKKDRFIKCKTGYKRMFWIWKGKFSGSPKEKEIYIILYDLKLKCYCEVIFERELNKRFDFYLPTIDVVIEYDGRQHFNNIKQLGNDLCKDGILINKGIKFFRYNRTHFNLKECIYNDLKKYINYDQTN